MTPPDPLAASIPPLLAEARQQAADLRNQYAFGVSPNVHKCLVWAQTIEHLVAALTAAHPRLAQGPQNAWANVAGMFCVSHSAGIRCPSCPPMEDLPPEAARVLREHAWELYDGTPVAKDGEAQAMAADSLVSERKPEEDQTCAAHPRPETEKEQDVARPPTEIGPQRATAGTNEVLPRKDTR